MDKSSLVATPAEVQMQLGLATPMEVQMIYRVEQTEGEPDEQTFQIFPCRHSNSKQHHIKHHNKYKYKKQHTY